MNAQQFFDSTVAHLRAQGEPSIRGIGNGGGCAYRGEGGKRCAVGFHITDAEYKQYVMEGYAASVVAEELPTGHVVRVHTDLATAMQSAHDQAARDLDNPDRPFCGGERYRTRLEDMLRQLAADRGLIYTPPQPIDAFVAKVLEPLPECEPAPAP